MSGTVWLVAAVLLLGLELLHPVFVLCWFAAGALAVAGAAALGLLALPAQLLLFCGVSAPLVLGSRTIWKDYLLKLSPGRHVRTNVHALPGGVGRVLADIDNAQGGGRILLDGMEWQARSLDGDPIAAGRDVRVISVEGVTLIVEPDYGSELETQ